MKRFLILSLIALFCTFMTAGYSDSGVIKETSFQEQIQVTYDVTVQLTDADVGYESRLSDSQSVETFILFVPEFDKPSPSEIRLLTFTSAGFIDVIRPPPDRCQKSEFS